MTPLQTIKITHTAIWALMVFLIGYIGYAGIADTVDGWTWAAIGVVGVECVVVVANGWRCPLTRLAARHTEPTTANFDIYLPEWLARRNQVIFGTLFGLGLVGIIYRVLSDGG